MSKWGILADEYIFCNANLQASFGYPVPHTFSHARAFSVERMRERQRRRKVNDLCHVTELANRI